MVSIFHHFAQVLHASQRPLPTQTGDGTYINKDLPSGVMEDLRSLGFKDVKTYLMERVIQLVSALPSN